MSCWREGELRAWLDGELSLRDMERAAAHINECVECAGLSAELKVRSEAVGTLLGYLPETAGPLVLPELPVRHGPAWRWVVVGAATAAVAALVMLNSPKPLPAPQPATPAIVVKAAAPAPAAPTPVRAKPLVRRRAIVKPMPHVEDFIALDNEPIETGVVVRIDLEAGWNGVQVPADVIFGPDGRARAIRLISDISGER